jgi:hypothetical protein
VTAARGETAGLDTVEEGRAKPAVVGTVEDGTSDTTGAFAVVPDGVLLARAKSVVPVAAVPGSLGASPGAAARLGTVESTGTRESGDVNAARAACWAA